MLKVPSRHVPFGGLRAGGRPVTSDSQRLRGAGGARGDGSLVVRGGTISASPYCRCCIVAFSVVVPSLTVYLLCLYVCVCLVAGSRAQYTLYYGIGVILLLLTWRVGAGGRRNDDVEEK